MATQIDSVDITGLRKAHFDQLCTYIYHIETDGIHWGNKKQFDKRHYDLMNWANKIRDLVYSEDIKIKEAGE